MPKPFDSLSDAEVVALNDEQVKFYMDLACAEDGAPLLPPDPGPEPEPIEKVRDVTVYSVEGIHFATQEAAQEVAALLATLPRVDLTYARGGHYSDQVAKPDTGAVATSSTQAYSLAGWDQARERVTAHNSKVEQYEKDREAYNKAAETRSRVTEWISTRIREAHESEWTRGRMEAEFERYVALAEGDRAMARRFLLKAHPEAEKFIRPIEMPPEAAVAQ